MVFISNVEVSRLRRQQGGITVLRTANPDRFFVRRADPYGRDARVLEDYGRIAREDSNVCAVVEEELYEGAPVFFRERDRYHRAVVASDPDEDGEVSIWLGDWGMETVAGQEELATLPEQYRGPFLAIPCGLGGIRPRGGEEWTEEAIERARAIMGTGVWEMEIQRIDRAANAIWVTMRREEDEGVVDVAQVLVAEGYAETCHAPRHFFWEEDGGIFADHRVMRWFGRQYGEKGGRSDREEETVEEDPGSEEREDQEDGVSIASMETLVMDDEEEYGDEEWGLDRFHEPWRAFFR